MDFLWWLSCTLEMESYDNLDTKSKNVFSDIPYGDLQYQSSLKGTHLYFYVVWKFKLFELFASIFVLSWITFWTLEDGPRVRRL